jgi:MFS family permease
MHAEPPLPAAKPDDGRPWYKELNRYHWFVLIVCALGWMFDTMDQQLFNIARRPAMRALIPREPGAEPDKNEITAASGFTTAVFLIGWGTGGLIFGILGDLMGRAKSMMITILLYSVFTGLSALSTGVWDFALYRFLTGLGVGGEFAVGVSLVAEVMPDRARPFALGLLQALSAVGNITAAVMGIALAFLARAEVIGESWRIMFVVGAVPALLAAFVFWRLEEPERWRQVAAQYTAGERLRSYFGELFRNPRWAKNALVGLLLAASGIIGLWGIGFFSIDLQRSIFRGRLEANQTLGPANVAFYESILTRCRLLPEPGTALAGADITFYEDVWASVTSVVLNVGAFFGIYAFSRVTHRIGRRRAFAIAFVLAMFSTAFVFWQLQSIGDVFWMIPIMGFCQLAIFGGYAIYFPELFPTRLRSTGTSFCYNIARFVAAAGPTMLGVLSRNVFGHFPQPEPLRYAGITMCVIFLLGLAVLPFAPETKGQPLPE